MMKYVRLTKMFIDENGKGVARCALYHTNKCLSPNTYDCTSCKMMQNILAQLCAFEDVYTEGECA